MIKRICDHCQNEYERQLFAFFRMGEQLYRVSIESASEQLENGGWKGLDLCLACRLQIVRNGGWVKG